MSLIITRVLTLVSAAMLAVLLPVSLAGADRDTPRNTPVSSGVVSTTVIDLTDTERREASSLYDPTEPQIIDALVVEREASPTDVIPNLPDVTFDDNAGR